MPANKGKPSSVQLDLPDLWISATHRTLDRSDEVDEGLAMMSQCSHDSLDDHKPGSFSVPFFLLLASVFLFNYCFIFLRSMLYENLNLKHILKA